MRVTGPLFSKTAHGTFAGVLTFLHRASGQVCRFQRRQKDANTGAQATQRAAFNLAVCACNAMEYGKAIYGVSRYGNILSSYVAAAERNHITAQNQCTRELINE
jgi:hypothetical protein